MPYIVVLCFLLIWILPWNRSEAATTECNRFTGLSVFLSLPLWRIHGDSSNPRTVNTDLRGRIKIRIPNPGCRNPSLFSLLDIELCWFQQVPSVNRLQNIKENRTEKYNRMWHVSGSNAEENNCRFCTSPWKKKHYSVSWFDIKVSQMILII